jgi:hypothetical protein
VEMMTTPNQNQNWKSLTERSMNQSLVVQVTLEELQSALKSFAPSGLDQKL